jgi:hypothetical protein
VKDRGEWRRLRETGHPILAKAQRQKRQSDGADRRPLPEGAVRWSGRSPGRSRPTAEGETQERERDSHHQADERVLDPVPELDAEAGVLQERLGLSGEDGIDGVVQADRGFDRRRCAGSCTPDRSRRCVSSEPPRPSR